MTTCAVQEYTGCACTNYPTGNAGVCAVEIVWIGVQKG
jgi:hypothetical protein